MHQGAPLCTPVNACSSGHTRVEIKTTSRSVKAILLFCSAVDGLTDRVTRSALDARGFSHARKLT